MPEHKVRPALPVDDLPVGEEGMGEHVWIDVIQKMDEVYSELLQYEVALEQKNAALEESQQFIFSVLSSISDILIVCDRSGRIVEANGALQKLVGREEKTLLGTPLVALFADATSRDRAERFQLQLGEEGVHDCEMQMHGAHGKPVAVTINVAPRYSGVGKLMGLVLTGRPVGELRRAYQALRDAHEQLKRTQQQLLQSEKMASLGRLVAGVAHELNNPISFVLGNVHALGRYATRLRQYLETIHEDGSAPAEIEALRRKLRIDHILSDLPSLLDGTIEGAERTRDIVDGLKRFSAADRNENKVFNLAEIVVTAAHWVSKATPRALQIDQDLQDPLPVLGSPGQMQQVVLNLVQNAVDATSDVNEPCVSIEGRVVGAWVEVVIQDNGPGIDPEVVDKIFEPFFTTKPVGKGTGLGLSISYGIVQRHGGLLDAGSCEGGGAEFILRLPLATT